MTDRHGIELPSETDIKDIEGNVTGELEEMDSQRRAKALGLGLPPKFTKELRNQDIEAPQKIEVKQDFEAGDGDTTDQTLFQKSKEQEIRERQLDARCRLQVDYQRHLQRTIVGF